MRLLTAPRSSSGCYAHAIREDQLHLRHVSGTVVESTECTALTT